MKGRALQANAIKQEPFRSRNGVSPVTGSRPDGARSAPTGAGFNLDIGLASHPADDKRAQRFREAAERRSAAGCCGAENYNRALPAPSAPRTPP